MSTDEFIKQLHDYFNDIKIIAGWKLDRQSSAYEILRPLLNEIITDLSSSKAAKELYKAITDASKNEGTEMMNYLTVELQFFHKLVKEFESKNEHKEKEDKGNKALGAAKTIKDSLEKWLKNCLESHPFLKRLLEILNELLSIIKCG